MKKNYLKKVLLVFMAVLFMAGCSGQTKTNPNQLNKDDCTITVKKLVHPNSDVIRMKLVFKNNSNEAKSCTEVINFQQGFISQSCDFEVYQDGVALEFINANGECDKKIEKGKSIKVELIYREYDEKGKKKLKVVFNGDNGKELFNNEYKVTEGK